MSSLLMVSITLVAGTAAFGFVNGQLRVSASSYGNQVAGNINFLNERESIVFVNFPGVGGADTQVSLWIQNTGRTTLSSYSLVISGLYCVAPSDTCAAPTNTFTITCLQGGGACTITGPECSGMSNALPSIASGQMATFTLTLPGECSITFQATSGSPPAPQTVSYTAQFAGQSGSSATFVKNR